MVKSTLDKKSDLSLPTWCKQNNNVLILSVHIQPSAKCNEIVGVVGDELKIKIASPPIEDKANSELIRYLASLCKIPKRQIKIKRGIKSRHKVIEMMGCGIEAVEKMI